MSSSPLQNPKPRKWRFTWETLAHIPALKLFIFNPDHRPSIHCKNLKSSLDFELSLLSISWNQDETNDRSVEFQLRAPIPRVLIDPSCPVDCRASEDHIEVKLVLLLPVDHPLVTTDFDSDLGFSEEGLRGGRGISDRLKPLSLDSGLWKLGFFFFYLFIISIIIFFSVLLSSSLVTSKRVRLGQIRSAQDAEPPHSVIH